MRRTAVINQIAACHSNEASLSESAGVMSVQHLPRILEDADAKLSGTLRMLLAQLKLATPGVYKKSIRIVVRFVSHSEDLKSFRIQKGEVNYTSRKVVSMAKSAPITIATEPIGSIPRPVDLIERVAKGDREDP